MGRPHLAWASEQVPGLCRAALLKRSRPVEAINSCMRSGLLEPPGRMDGQLKTP